MKQSVQVMVHLYFDNQNSEPIDGETEPTRDTIRKELYKIIKDEKPLSYTEIRGESIE